MGPGEGPCSTSKRRSDGTPRLHAHRERRKRLKEMMEHATQFPEEYSKVASVQKKVGEAGLLLTLLHGRRHGPGLHAYNTRRCHSPISMCSLRGCQVHEGPIAAACMHAEPACGPGADLDPAAMCTWRTFFHVPLPRPLPSAAHLWGLAGPLRRTCAAMICRKLVFMTMASHATAGGRGQGHHDREH